MRNGKYELVIAPEGYPGKRYRGRYAYEHHVVFWKTHGRMPEPGMVVHHKNDQKRQNDPGNLEEMTRAGHSSHHSSQRPTAWTTLICAWCAEVFQRRNRHHKPWQERNYCCRSHQVRDQQKRIRLSLQGG